MMVKSEHDQTSAPRGVACVALFALGAALLGADGPGLAEVRCPWRVVNAETGKPLAGVAIAATVYPESPSVPPYRSTEARSEAIETFSARSDADGRFSLNLPGRLRSLKSVILSVEGSIDGHATGSNSSRIGFEPDKAEAKPATLTLRRGEVVSGRHVLGPDGSPSARRRLVFGTSFPPGPGKDYGVYVRTTGATGLDGRFRVFIPAGGRAALDISPPDAVPFRKELGEARGDLGDLRLEAGASVAGRVVDVSGKPIAMVSVGIAPTVDREEDYYIENVTRRAITDANGRFAIPPVPPGDYRIAPVPDVEIVGGEMPGSGLPPAYRKFAEPGAGLHLDRPLPAVFPKRIVALAAGGPAFQVEIAAVPHATFTARFEDSRGRPAPIGLGYEVSGKLDGREWRGDFAAIPGRDDAMSALVPVGLRDVDVRTSFGDEVWWTWAPGLPRLTLANVHLKEVDGDRPGIVVQRPTSASLEIRVRARVGEVPDRTSVGVFYPRKGGADGGRSPERVAPGVYRLDSGLLPGREAEIHVRAPGFKGLMTRGFQFTEDGQKGIVEVTIEPGESNDGFRLADAVPVVLRDPDGRPIAPPAIPKGPDRAIACRAVDKATGLPVGDAAVVSGVEQWKNAEGEEEHEESDGHETKTDADGRFTVLVPEKYLPDPSPQRFLRVRVTIRHPRYVAYFNTADPREIADKGVSESFPEFRAVQLLPAREVSGRLLGTDGRPLPDVSIYKTYDQNNHPLDADFPTTDKDGRFRTNVPVGSPVKLEFRSLESARTYVDVGADRTDLGDVRVTRGVRVTGRVLDADGQPVPFIGVNTPSDPNSQGQPNFVYTTDKDGRFRTDELPPGRYLVKVGAFHKTEDGKDSPLAVRDAPGVYIPAPLEIKAGQSVPDPILRPTPHVLFLATLEPPRPGPQAAGAIEPPRKDDDPAAALAGAFQAIPIITVRGRYEGAEWNGNEFSFAAAGIEPGKYPLRVPMGLEDATLGFGDFVQRFRLDANSPELFGPSIRIGRVDAERLDIRIRRYRDTTLKVHVAAGGAQLPADLKVGARYVREPEMRAAGVVFDAPVLRPLDAGGELRLKAIPDEEVEVSAVAPGLASAPARVKLAEGEARVINLTLSPAR